MSALKGFCISLMALLPIIIMGVFFTNNFRHHNSGLNTITTETSFVPPAQLSTISLAGRNKLEADPSLRFLDNGKIVKPLYPVYPVLISKVVSQKTNERNNRITVLSVLYYATGSKGEDYGTIHSGEIVFFSDLKSTHDEQSYGNGAEELKRVVEHNVSVIRNDPLNGPEETDTSDMYNLDVQVSPSGSYYRTLPSDAKVPDVSHEEKHEKKRSSNYDLDEENVAVKPSGSYYDSDAVPKEKEQPLMETSKESSGFDDLNVESTPTGSYYNSGGDMANIERGAVKEISGSEQKELEKKFAE